MAARRSAADHMDDAAKAGTDPDYLFFLRHLYPSGTSYVLDIPAADWGSRPPVVIKYEYDLEPVFGAGAGIEGVGEHEPEPAVIDPPPTVREDDGASSSSVESNGAQEVSISVSDSAVNAAARRGRGSEEEEKGTAGKE